MKKSDQLPGLFAELGNVKTLTQALTLYKMVGLSSLKQRSRIEYENDLADLVAYLERGGIKTPDKVTLTHLRIYLADLERRDYKPSTRNRKTWTIKAFFRFLRDYGVVRQDIATQLVPPQVERGEPRFLTEGEYMRLLHVARASPRDTAIIELLLQTGIRLSELVGLTIRDVTLEISPASDEPNSSSIRIRRGGGHATTPINHKAQNALRRWLEIREPIPDTALFLTAVNKPMGKRAVQLMLGRYLEAAEIHSASVQSLRHTMIVHHLAKGTPLRTLADILGVSPDALKTYAPLACRLAQRALQEHAL